MGLVAGSEVSAAGARRLGSLHTPAPSRCGARKPRRIRFGASARPGVLGRERLAPRPPDKIVFKDQQKAAERAQADANGWTASTSQSTNQTIAL
jgi:hypothetical protein